MQNKLLLMAGLFILVFSIIYWKTGTKTDLSIPTNNTVENIENTDIIEVKNVDSKKTLSNIEELPKKDEVVDENNTNIFDMDPVVDSTMMIANNRMCYSFLSERFNSMRVKAILNSNYNDRQKQYHKNYSTHCQQLNQSKPELNLKNISAIELNKTTKKATSLWGKILSREIDADTLTEYEQLDLLKQNNLNILENSPKYLREYYNEVIHWDLEDVLQNRHYNYVKLIQDYAHNLYLCQNGKDCSPNSSQMALICLYVTSDACGLDYSQFVYQVLTPGQQADITLAVDYLASKYQ